METPGTEKLEISHEDFMTRALGMPGAISAVFVLSILIPIFGFFPSAIILTMFISFAVPTFYIFLIRVALNREIGLRKHLLATLSLSFVLYILIQSAWETATIFYIHSYFFLLGALLGGVTYLFYWLFFKLGKKLARGEPSYRMRFLLAFLPTVVIMVFVSFALSLYLGGFSFSLIEVLQNGV